METAPTTRAGVDASLDELRLHPSWVAVRAHALSQALAARFLGDPAVDDVVAVADDVWFERGIADHDDLAAWMSAREVDDTVVRRMLIGETTRRRADEQYGDAIDDELMSQFLLDHASDELVARARRKRSALSAHGLLGADRPVDADYQELLTWTVQRFPHLSRHVLGHQYYERPDQASFIRALIDEYHYIEHCDGETLDARSTDDPGSRVVLGGAEDGTSDPLLGDLDEFGATRWGRHPMIRRMDGFDADEILSLADIDRLLANRHLDARLIERNIFVDERRTRRTGLDRHDGRTWLLDTDALIDGFRSGQTIIVPVLHEVWAPVQRLAADLATHLGADVTAWLFVSPPGAASSWHADGSHGVILQLHGSKHWWVEHEVRADPSATAPPEVLDVHLSPGDVLYVPQEVRHRVHADRGESVHITFNCSDRSSATRLVAAIEEAIRGRAPELLHSFAPRASWGPRSAARAAAVAADIRSAAVRLVDELSSEVSDRIGAGETPAASVPTLAADGSGGLTSAIASFGVDAGSLVVAAPGARLDITGDRIRIVGTERSIEIDDCPSRWSTVLGAVTDGSPVRVDEHPEAVRQARRLVAHGVLHLVSGGAS